MMVCVHIVGELFPEATHVGQRLVEVAAARSEEPLDLRLAALKAAGHLKPTRMLGERLLPLLALPEPRW